MTIGRLYVYNKYAFPMMLLSAILFSCTTSTGGKVEDSGPAIMSNESVDVADGVPAVSSVPFPGLDSTVFRTKVTLEFGNGTVLFSQLPQGVEVDVEGCEAEVRSVLPGVEYIVKGKAAPGSLTIISERSPLVTLAGADISAKGMNALQVSSLETIFLRIEGRNYVADAAGAVKADKQSAAVKLMGKTLLCGDGSLDVSSARRNGILCTDTLFVSGADVNVYKAPGNALLLGKSAYVADGSLKLSSEKDVIKGKNASFVITGGDVLVKATSDKADAIQVGHFGMKCGVLNLDVSGAAADGIKAGVINFSGGTVTVETAGDALFSEKKMDYSSASCMKADTCIYISGGDFALCSRGSGGKGLSSDGDIVVAGGCVNVVTHGKEAAHPVDLNVHASSKGVKCDSSFVMSGGEMEVVVLGAGARNEGVESKGLMRIAGDSKLYVYAYDDALNAGDLVVDGGRLFAYSVTNDAVDSNGTITVNGGLVIADGSFSPEQGIDTDFPDKFRVTGGTLFSVGGTMGPSPCLPMADGTSVPGVSCSGLELKKGCFLSLVDEKGRSLYSYRLQRDMTDGGVLVVSGKLPSRGDCAFVLSDSIDGGIYVANGISENAVPAGVDRSVAFAIGGNVTAVSRDGGVIDVEKFMMNMPPPPPHGAMSPGDSMPVPPGFPMGMIPPGDSVPVHPGMFPHRKMPFPPPARLEVKSEYGIGNLPNHK